MSHCVEQGTDDWCQSQRGPGSSYDVMSRSILELLPQMRRLWVHATTPHVIYIQHKAAEKQICRANEILLGVAVKSGMFGKPDLHTPGLKHANISKDIPPQTLTIAPLSILRDSKTGLTDNTCERTLSICTCSLGAGSGQGTLINIC